MISATKFIIKLSTIKKTTPYRQTLNFCFGNNFAFGFMKMLIFLIQLIVDRTFYFKMKSANENV